MTPRSLRFIVADVLQVSIAEINEESGMNLTTNWDSLNHFVIVTTLERELGARVVFDEMEALSTVKEIRSFLVSQGIELDD